MKNKKKTRFALAATACILATTVPVYANVNFENISDILQEDQETVSYVIDFLDYDGNILDSRICTYGEELKDIKIPEQREDESYIYQFIEWEPQLSTTVTGCATYTALYQRSKKVSNSDEELSFEPIPQETSEFPEKTASDYAGSEEITQVSSTSYDVTSFHIETPAQEISLFTNTNIEETETTREIEPQEKSNPVQKNNQTVINITVIPEENQLSLAPATLEISSPMDTIELPKTSTHTDTDISAEKIPQKQAQSVHPSPIHFKHTRQTQPQKATILPAENPQTAPPFPTETEPRQISPKGSFAFLFLLGMAISSGTIWIKDKMNQKRLRHKPTARKQVRY